jgi:hypothetical protein
MVLKYGVRKKHVSHIVKSSKNGKERLRSQSITEMRMGVWSHDKGLKMTRYFTCCKGSDSV